MVKKFETFIADTNKDYEYEDIVVAKFNTTGGIKKDKKYILVYPQPTWMNGGTLICVKDIVNNQVFYSNKANFITETEYELGDDAKKYNL